MILTLRVVVLMLRRDLSLCGVRSDGQAIRAQWIVIHCMQTVTRPRMLSECLKLPTPGRSVGRPVLCLGLTGKARSDPNASERLQRQGKQQQVGNQVRD